MNEKIIDKLTSGKFLTTVFVVGTYCLCIVACVGLAFLDKISIQVFLGLFSGFTGLAGMIVQGYFHKKEEVK